MLQAVECGRGSRMRSIGRCIGKFEWQDMSGGVVRELSKAAMKCMLLSVAWTVNSYGAGYSSCFIHFPLLLSPPYFGHFIALLLDYLFSYRRVYIHTCRLGVCA